MALRYWVGGTANWDGNASAKWSTTSGGASGAAAPTAADDVFFDAASGAGTVTVLTSALAKNVDFTGFTGTLAGSTAMTISGSLIAATGMTWSYTGTINLNPTSGTSVLTSAGKTFNNSITINAVGGTIQLTDNHSNNSGKTLTHTAGTLDLNGKTLTIGTFNTNNSNTRAIITGTGGNIVITTSNGTQINGATLTGLTITGALAFSYTYAGSVGTRTINWGGTAGATVARAVSISIPTGSDNISIAVGSQFQNLIFGSNTTWSNIASGAVSIAGDLTFSAGMSIAFTGTVTFNGTSGTPQQITTNAKNLANMTLVFNGAGGSYKLIDNLLILTVLTLTNGTLDLNGKNVDCNGFVLGAGTKTLTIGSGYLGISSSGTNVFDAVTNASGLTVSAATGQIRMGGATAKTFKGGGFTWPILVQSQVGALTVEGGNTFSDIQRTQAGDIILPASTTTTVSALTLGSSGALKSSSAGVAATISDASGTNSISNTTLIDIAATGGATWNALGANLNVDGGGNSGWNFGTPVNCYWVGGTNSWDGTPGTKWAATSGGAGGQPIPTLVDSVFFDAASGAVTVTVAAGNTGAGSITTTGFTGTLAGASGLSIAANIVLNAGMTLTYNGLITFVGGTAKTITTNGKTLTGSVTMDAVSATLRLLDNFNGSSATTTVTLTNGSIDLNGFTLSTRIFATSNSNVRSIIFGGGNITVTGSGATVLSGATLTNLTITGTPVFNCTYSGSTGTRTFQWGTTAGGIEANSVIVNITAGSDIIALGSKFRGVNLTGSSVTQSAGALLTMYGSFTMSATATWSSSSSLSFLHTSGTAVITGAGKTFLFDMIINAVGGTVQLGDNFTLSATSVLNLTAGTLDLNGKNFTAGALSTNNANVRNITSGSGGKISLAANGSTVINGTDLTNLTITGSPAIDLTYAGATGIRTVIWGATGTAATAVDLNIKAGTDSIKFSLYVWVNNLNFTGFNGTWTTPSADTAVGGDLTLSTGMTYNNTGDIYFDGPGSLHQITTAGKSIIGNMFLDGPPGATARLMDDLTFTGVAGPYLDLGTFDTNGKTVTADWIDGNNSGAVTLVMGASHFIITGTFALSASPLSTITYSAGAKISMAGASAKSFDGVGLTYPVLEQTGTGAIAITGANTFDDIQRTAAGDILLPASTTTTVLALTLGSSGALKSDDPGVYATLSKASGTVSISNTTITDVHATGGATFNALTSNGNVDGGGNTGWNFTAGGPAVNQGAFFQFMRRP